MDDIPLAQVRVEGQRVILDDPEATALFEYVAWANCLQTAEVFRERIQHFTHRVEERRDDPREVVILLAWAFDEVGGPLADTLMPGTDWQAQANEGIRPYARGLAGRDGIERLLADRRPAAAQVLKALPGLAVVVIDHGTAAVFPAGQFA